MEKQFQLLLIDCGSGGVVVSVVVVVVEGGLDGRSGLVVHQLQQLLIDIKQLQLRTW